MSGATGLASESKNGKLPYGRSVPAACCGELQYKLGIDFVQECQTHLLPLGLVSVAPEIQVKKFHLGLLDPVQKILFG
jgi:hypothetical protein